MLRFAFGKKTFNDDASRPFGSVIRLTIQATHFVPNEYRLDLAPSFACFLRIPDGSAPTGELFFLKRSHVSGSAYPPSPETL
ncbi:MAG: hypothetical protein HSCHL_0212 [Hydrogenibacillus schlegelii]|uniref:Uncharacterized protein n=1 Tax=Hydrogenibacillus schlegelii TaxID=1484 RepID=A0A2T5G3I1_HYDSH|nr:MAG: hypothetical protein HSCHL_0212 [Hydrogenibacillus schlegelii]